LSTFEEVAALACNADVFAVRFSPDGQWLAAATIDGKIHLWHAPSFDEIARAETGGRPVPVGPVQWP
jgi:WD40 repeat protein